jgi:hypothetical protein
MLDAEVEDPNHSLIMDRLDCRRKADGWRRIPGYRPKICEVRTCGHSDAFEHPDVIQPWLLYYFF